MKLPTHTNRLLILTGIAVMAPGLQARPPLEHKQSGQSAPISHYLPEASDLPELFFEQLLPRETKPKKPRTKSALQSRVVRKKRRTLKPRVETVGEKDTHINMHHIALALHTTGYILTIAHTKDKRKKKRAIRALSTTISEILEEVLL